LRKLLAFAPARPRDADAPERFADYRARSDIATQHPL